MLSGGLINVLGAIVFFAGFYRWITGRGHGLIWLAFFMIGVGTVVYYIARFIVYIKTGRWDNTGLHRKE